MPVGDGNVDLDQLLDLVVKQHAHASGVVFVVTNHFMLLLGALLTPAGHSAGFTLMHAHVIKTVTTSINTVDKPGTPPHSIRLEGGILTQACQRPGLAFQVSAEVVLVAPGALPACMAPVGNFIPFDGGWYMIRFLAVLILENDKLLLDGDWHANGFLDMFPLKNKALTLDPVVNMSSIDLLWKQAGPLLLKLVPPQSGRGLDVADEGIGDIVCCSILNAVKSDQTFSQAAARRLN